MTTMRALIKEGLHVSVQSVPKPELVAPDDVIVRVMVAGLCRTDVAVAHGRMACRDPLVLGHELSGTIDQVGSEVGALSPGDRVTVMPALTCGHCAGCASSSHCTARRMLGVDEHGAFAEYVRVPARSIHRLPPELTFEVGAYVEPIAAALAVTTVHLSREERGVIVGHNRIAGLVAKVMAVSGYRDVEVVADFERLERDGYDWVVETSMTSESMRAIVHAARPFGTVVLKSRPPAPVELDVALAVRKSITFRAVEYAPFDAAIRFASNHRALFDELLGESHALDDFARVFAESATSEAKKTFFRLHLD